MALTKIQAAGLTADLIDETKLADNSIDSEHYNDGSIDNAHLADDAVGVAELSATGTASSSTFLRGDNSWATPAGKTTEEVQDIVGAMFTGNTETNITATYEDGDGTIDLVASAGVGGANAVTFNDSVAANFGTDGDQAIWHTGSAGYIRNSTGGLVIRNDAFSIKDDAESETLLTATKDGSVALYYDNSKKLETTSYGSAHTGIMRFENSGDGISLYDSRELKIGDGDDLKLYHDGSNTYIRNNVGDLVIYTVGTENVTIKTNSEKAIDCVPDGAVELYYDNVKTFNTVASGIQVRGPEGGNCELFMYADEGDDNNDLWKFVAFHTPEGTLDLYNKASGSWEKNIGCVGNGAVELYYDNVKRLETTASGVTIPGGQYLQVKHDSGRLTFGADDDMQFYHDGSVGRLYNTTGSYVLRADSFFFQKGDGSEHMARFINDGACELWHDNSKKLETTSGGVSVTGNVAASNDIEIPNDSGKIKLGTGSDLSIFHNGTDSIIDNNTGELKIETGIFNVRTDNGNENSIYCTYDEGVKLYYDGTEKFRTTALGATITGAGNRALKVNCTHSSGGEILSLDNGVSSHYGGLVVSGGEIDREARIEAAYGDSLLTFWTNNAEHFRIANNGDLTATDTSIGSNSDSRLKKNIANYTYDLAKFKQFQPKTFDWINKAAHGNKTGQRGFLAQDLESIDTKLVGSIELDPEHLDKDLVDSDRIAKTAKLGENDAMYISVINQLISKIETLETKVAALEAA